VAQQIAILPRTFPIIFDDQQVDSLSGNIVEFKGRIVKPCVKGKLEQPGKIKYKNYQNYQGAIDEIEYYERDRQNSFTILVSIFYKAIRFLHPYKTIKLLTYKAIRFSFNKEIRIKDVMKVIRIHRS